MLRYSRIQKITALLRCLEVIAAAAALLWFSAHLPAAARYSGDLLRRLFLILLGPRFLFLLGNAIVLTLLLNSRRSKLTAAGSSDVAAIASIGDEISASFTPPMPPAAIDPPPEVVFEDKKVCIEDRAPPAAAPARKRACRRSRSERMGEQRQGSPELRRAETDVGRGKAEDEEEFRRTIEAFIEKQWKFQREETMATIALCSVSTTPTPDDVVDAVALNRSAGTPEHD